MHVDQLADALRSDVESAPRGQIKVRIHLFGIRHANDLRWVSLSALVAAAGIRASYVTEIRSGMNLADFVDLRKELFSTS